MERKLIRTADGSPTLRIPEWNEQYHSTHGAVQEAYHVFIRAGLQAMPTGPLRILEMGFGTGLNALITLLEAKEDYTPIHYTALEAFPLGPELWSALEYGKYLGHTEASGLYKRLHETPWESFEPITPGFQLRKLQMDFLSFRETDMADLVYFDAFGARVQPELWTEPVFQAMYQALSPGGKLVTYAAKGSVRRAMQAAGFSVERLPGPPGKREMLRASR